ncbi:glutamate racemase [Fusibacter ferrireducens]|uniref:Glutamate racemase n=1 Tax=Fusibacter ferrireducens TaxID=2785058 RepID=A0ABR9ZTM0_9FIRM|nr:glutamate racemase [Fusibacter ferrireducens]MBF4693225.1 glutamate racemase [Fusibacter ferrireducens]
MNKNSKIGVFDSGLGGISVLYEIHKLMPNESIVYFGDSGNAPYGIKTKEEVVELSKRICDHLIEKEDVKAIVIACNTATSAAVDILRGQYNIPIIGMEPAIKPAITGTEGVIVVMATEMTLKEEKFNNLLYSFEEAHRIIKMPSPELVDVVENHMDDIEYIKKSISNYLDSISEHVEGIVLGCTHFIFLKDFIDEYYDHKVEIFDGNFGTASQLRNVLHTLELLSDETFEGEISIFNSRDSAFVEKSKNLYQYLRKREQDGHK